MEKNFFKTVLDDGLEGILILKPLACCHFMNDRYMTAVIFVFCFVIDISKQAGNSLEMSLCLLYNNGKFECPFWHKGQVLTFSHIYRGLAREKALFW